MCDVIAVTIFTSIFAGNKTKRMAGLNPSFCVYSHFARKFEVSERQWD